MTAYGNVTATIPAPAPPGQAPAPVRDAKKIALPKGLNTPPAKLPAAVTGIPRTGIDGSSYEGGFEIDNSKYLESLAGQMLPGIVMAVLLFVIMILMLLVYLVSTLCGLTFCKCCNGAYKPRRFSKKDLKINKVVCLVFCAITAAGAFAVFAETPPLLENTKDLTGAMAGTISELSANVTAIADAMEAAAKDPTLAIGDIASTTKTMKDAMASVDKTVQDAQDQIEEYVDMSGLYVTIAAGIMFGITFIVFALGFVGFWRLLIFFTIILSIMMIIGWIVWGLLSLLTVFVDDLCWAMNDYLRDRYNSDLSDFIPCMDPKVAVSTMNVARDQVASGIAAVNDQLEEYSGGESGNPYLKYLCYNYAKVPLKDLCNKKTIYHDQAYSTFVCQAEDQKKLTEKADMTSYDSTIQDLIMFPDAFCPYPTNFYSVALGNFSKPASDGGLGQLRCPFKGYSDDAHDAGDRVFDGTVLHHEATPLRCLRRQGINRRKSAIGARRHAQDRVAPPVRARRHRLLQDGWPLRRHGYRSHQPLRWIPPRRHGLLPPLGLNARSHLPPAVLQVLLRRRGQVLITLKLFPVHAAVRPSRPTPARICVL